MTEQPQRWWSAFPPGHSARYVQRFRDLRAQGADLDGEARLVDALLPRAARVLDAGCGQGRTGAALHARGHTVVGVDVDPLLVEAARADHPGPRWLVGDLARLDLDEAPFDLAVLAGNVLVYVEPGTERQVLSRLRAHLRPGGAVVAGFAAGQPYDVSALDRDAMAAGLTPEHRFAGWDLQAWSEDCGWSVSVLRVPPT